MILCEFQKVFALEHGIFRVVYKFGDWATFLVALGYEYYRLLNSIGLFLFYWFNCQLYIAKKMQFMRVFSVEANFGSCFVGSDN